MTHKYAGHKSVEAFWDWNDDPPRNPKTQQWYAATVLAFNSDGTYNVLFEDESKGDKYPEKYIRLSYKYLRSKVKEDKVHKDPRVGDKVDALWETDDELGWYPATIRRQNRDGSYELLFKDGDVKDLRAARIRVGWRVLDRAYRKVPNESSDDEDSSSSSSSTNRSNDDDSSEVGSILSRDQPDGSPTPKRVKFNIDPPLAPSGGESTVPPVTAAHHISTTGPPHLGVAPPTIAPTPDSVVKQMKPPESAVKQIKSPDSAGVPPVPPSVALSPQEEEIRALKRERDANRQIIQKHKDKIVALEQNVTSLNQKLATVSKAREDAVKENLSMKEKARKREEDLLRDLQSKTASQKMAEEQSFRQQTGRHANEVASLQQQLKFKEVDNQKLSEGKKGAEFQVQELRQIQERLQSVNHNLLLKLEEKDSIIAKFRFQISAHVEDEKTIRSLAAENEALESKLQKKLQKLEENNESIAKLQAENEKLKESVAAKAITEKDHIIESLQYRLNKAGDAAVYRSSLYSASGNPETQNQFKVVHSISLLQNASQEFSTLFSSPYE